MKMLAFIRVAVITICLLAAIVLLIDGLSHAYQIDSRQNYAAAIRSAASLLACSLALVAGAIASRSIELPRPTISSRET